MENYGRYRAIRALKHDRYVAQDPLVGRKVILELLPLGPESFAWARARAQVRSPLVEKLLDLGVGEDRSFLISEFVEGRSLQEVGFDRKYRQPLLEALQAIHEAGIQHGALHSRNVIITPEGVLRLVGLRWTGQDDRAATADLLAQLA